MREVFQFRFYKIGKFGILFFVDDIIIGIGLHIFGRGHQALGANAKSQFFDSSF